MAVKLHFNRPCY